MPDPIDLDALENAIGEAKFAAIQDRMSYSGSILSERVFQLSVIEPLIRELRAARAVVEEARRVYNSICINAPDGEEPTLWELTDSLDAYDKAIGK